MILRGSYIIYIYIVSSTGAGEEYMGMNKLHTIWEKAVLGNGVICGGRDRECEWGMNSGSGEQLDKSR